MGFGPSSACFQILDVYQMLRMQKAGFQFSLIAAVDSGLGTFCAEMAPCSLLPLREDLSALIILERCSVGL